MLSHSPFYHSHLRKLITSFGTIFNDISIQRKDNTDNVIKTISVPISYAPKEFWVARLQQDPNPNIPGQATPIKMIVPRMGFEMINMTYDHTRKLISTGQNVAINTEEGDTILSQFQPVPWNIDFGLYIMTRNIDDSLQIIEQILPFFTPDFMITIKEMPGMNLIRDIPIVYGGISSEIIFDGTPDKVRTIMWNLSFTMKGYLYQPIRKVKIIKDSTVNLIAESTKGNSGTSIRAVVDPIDAKFDDTWQIQTEIRDFSE
jgi:hypothetical protein